MTNYREQQRAGGYVRDPAQPAEDAPYPHDELAILRAQRDELAAALENLRKELRAAVKFDVKKHYSLMVADVAADKAIAKARGQS